MLQDNPLLTWRDRYRQQYLDENLALEGRGRTWGSGLCVSCDQTAYFRCQDCSLAAPLCRDYAIVTHRLNPLHVLEVSEYARSCLSMLISLKQWKGSRFQPTTLQELGLHIQLGHGSRPCPMKVTGHTDFVVIAINGIHRVNLDFCGCLNRPDPHIQLLEMRWWPSTPIAPQTAATMDLLRIFHVLNLQSRVPPTDFYRSLVRLVDGQGLKRLLVCCITGFY